MWLYIVYLFVVNPSYFAVHMQDVTFKINFLKTVMRLSYIAAGRYYKITFLNKIKTPHSSMDILCKMRKKQIIELYAKKIAAF
jgi:hypothetical protein